MVVNGDIVTDFPFQRLRDRAIDLAHLILVPNPPHNKRGDFFIRRGKVVGADENCLTFSGVGVYRPELFQACPPGRYRLAPLLRAAMASEKVTGERYDGFWMDIGTKQRLYELNEKLVNLHLN